MLSCTRLHAIFRQNGLTFFTGVPDSTFQGWMSYLDLGHADLIHRPAPNEGTAIAQAAGYHLATGRAGVVYLQNSGLGNCVNPLTSLADRDVYGMPMVLMIGWRGEPGRRDEPQHAKMGRVQLALLDVLEVPYAMLDADGAEQQVAAVTETSRTESRPAALIVRTGVIELGPHANAHTSRAADPGAARARARGALAREEAIAAVARRLPGAIFVSTTGKISRELFAHRERTNGDHGADFYTVGSMGHASAIASEIAAQVATRRVCVLDGDGALLMHMGALAAIGAVASPNLLHVVLDNGCHDSTGGQPTVSASLDVEGVARACGYLRASTVTDLESLERELQLAESGPRLIVVKVAPGSRADLGRPTTTPLQNKLAFMRTLGGQE